MLEPLVVVGCGGHGRGIISIVQAINANATPRWNLIGVVDDKPSAINLDRLSNLGVAYIGKTAEINHHDSATRYVIGIGDSKARAAVANHVDASRRPATLVHPDATVGPQTHLGDGVVLFPGVRLTTNARVGRHVHLLNNVSVGHDTVIDDFASVYPLAAISGECHIGERALIGANAVVLQGRLIGAGATVGAGACVTQDVDMTSVVKGVPAR